MPYATSRISALRNAYSPSLVRATSSRSMRPSSAATTSVLAASPTAASVSAPNVRPMTAAACRSARCRAGSMSMRARTVACTVSGNARSRKRRLGELFDKIDEAVRRVLQILEHDEERALRRDPLDEAAPRADDLLAVLIRRGLLRCDRERDEHRVALAAGAVHHTADLSAHVLGRRVGRHADEIDEELAERTVGEHLAVRRAVRVRIPRGRRKTVAELVRETAFARPRWRGDRDEIRTAVAEGPLRDELELREIVLAADERRRRRLVS